jgi:signal transduction histidine kinase
MIAGAPGGLLHRLRHPQTTVRWRLTLLYGGLFLVSGAVLLAVTDTLVAHVTFGPAARVDFFRGPVPKPAFGISGAPLILPVRIKQALISVPGQNAIKFVLSNQRVADLHQLEVVSAVALAIMAVISGLLGWLIAGRVLRPLRTITATTQQISAASLHRRLAMPGPRDELRQLADTIDGLLERLEGAFDAQRRFVANASHELRTPLTAARAMLEMVMTDPRADVNEFRRTCGQVLSENEHQEQLIDALLTLAQGQRGLDHREAVDLATIVSDEVSRQAHAASAREIRVSVALEPAIVAGEARLIERLVSNLLENAIRHNEPQGDVRIAVATPAGRPTLTVSNTGPAVPPEEIARLLQPFQRLAPNRIGHGDGLGLGLSIVAAIAHAHDAALRVEPRAGGGLEIEVQFPRTAQLPDTTGSASEPDLVSLAATTRSAPPV